MTQESTNLVEDALTVLEAQKANLTRQQLERLKTLASHDVRSDVTNALGIDPEGLEAMPEQSDFFKSVSALELGKYNDYLTVEGYGDRGLITVGDEAPRESVYVLFSFEKEGKRHQLDLVFHKDGRIVQTNETWNVGGIDVGPTEKAPDLTENEISKLMDGIKQVIPLRKEA